MKLKYPIKYYLLGFFQLLVLSSIFIFSLTLIFEEISFMHLTVQGLIGFATFLILENKKINEKNYAANFLIYYCILLLGFFAIALFFSIIYALYPYVIN